MVNINVYKNSKKYSRSLIIFFIVLSIFLSSCSKGSGNLPNGGQNGNENNNTITPTSVVMVENGASEYKIVLPLQVAEYETFARDELILFLQRSLNVRLETISDKDLVLNSNSKYISLGKTSLFKQSGLSAEESSLGTTGYIIKTVGNTVFMCGGGASGTLFAVYEFLNRTIGYEYFAEDEIALDTLNKLALYNFNIVNKPSFEFPYLASSVFAGRTTAFRRMRQVNPWIPAGGNENTFTLINPTEYKSTHPDWFARTETGAEVKQLCFSAGDGLIDELTGKLIDILIESYLPQNYKEERTYLLIGQQDYWGWCRCEKCAAEYAKYQTDAAVLVKFVNKVAEKIENWIDENQPGRTVYVTTFAYMDTEKPPVKFDNNNNVLTDVNGNPIFIDESVKLRDNVIIRLAPIISNWYESFEAESNIAVQNVIKGWAALGKMTLWTYSIAFHSQYANFNNFNSLQPTYKYLSEFGVQHLYDEYLTGGYGNPCFKDYRIYLQCNLMWDVDADLTKLTENFFNNYYKAAAPTMFKYLKEIQLLYMDSWKSVGLNGNCNQVDLYLPSLWPMGTLLKWRDYMQEAYNSIKRYEVAEPDTYSKLYDRITMESVSVRYLLIRLYGETVYSEENLYNEKISLYNDIVRFDMQPKIAGQTIEDLKSEFGI